MKHVWRLMAVVLGFAAEASAGTLTVYTTDLSGNPSNIFGIGETFLLKVTGDGQGNTSEDSILGELGWNGAITDQVASTQGKWLSDLGGQFLSDGSAFAFNQTGPTTNAGVDTSTITLIGTGSGISNQFWGGSLLDFFGIYSYISGGFVLTGHSFTVTGLVPNIPEPSTAALIALGLLGPACVGRTRRRQKRTSRSSD
jgi:hypothetical protein